ncbi:putative transporter svop-1 [Spodoptera litura]|uniref:Transporter svop-1 n=1 Tax=Spodoptera litura TaxID=69820 RepID=A0A9J7EDS3_SPOLT|nr:putative transporter svop-1 [Spodoptera litura]
MTAKGLRVPFEDALNMTGYSRYNACLFILCASIIVGMTYEIFSVSYIVPASVCELHTTSTEQGLMASVPLIGIITTSHIWGYLADTRGRRKVLIISMTLTYLAGTAATLSPNWIVLSLLKLLSSSSVSGSMALSMTLLSECTPSQKRSGLVLLSTSAYLISIGVMAVIAIPVLPLTFSFYIPVLDIYFNSWRLLNLIFAVPCALCAVGCFFANESPKYLVSVGREEDALQVLKRMYVINTGKSAETYTVSALELEEGQASSFTKGFWGSVAAQTIPMVKPPLLKNTLLLSFLYVISYITMNAFFVWLPYIVNAFMTSVVAGERHLTICEMIRLSANSSTVQETNDCSMNSQAMILVFGIVMVLGVCNIFTSAISNCIGRKTLFVCMQVIAGGAALVINFSPFWVLSAILFMVFLSAVFAFGLLTSFCVDVFPTYVRAMAVCLTLMVGRGSAVVGINVLKKLLDTDCEAAFYIFGAVAVGGGLVGLLLPSDAKIIAQKKALNRNP